MFHFAKSYCLGITPCVSWRVYLAGAATEERVELADTEPGSCLRLLASWTRSARLNMQYAGTVMTLHLVVTSLSQSSHHKKSHHFHKFTEVTEVTGPITVTRKYCSTRDGHIAFCKTRRNRELSLTCPSGCWSSPVCQVH